LAWAELASIRADLLDIGLAAAQRRRQRQGRGQQAGVLAREEGPHEVAVGLGHQATLSPGLAPGRQQARRQHQGVLAQPGVGQGLDQLAAQRIEVDPVSPVAAKSSVGGQVGKSANRTVRSDAVGVIIGLGPFIVFVGARLFIAFLRRESGQSRRAP
jgi:hypothetical protein